MKDKVNTVLPSFDHLIKSLIREKKLKSKALISTVFGDLVVPNGGNIWVESICALFSPLSINNRLVRTSLFRLVEEGWLEATRQGRKSYYSLTKLGESQTKLAESLIYHHAHRKWDGTWTIVFLVMKPVDTESRSQLEQELSWIGFGRVANHVWAHPCIDTEVVISRITELKLQDKVVCMRCENIQNLNEGLVLDDKDLAMSCLPISAVQEEYRSFIEYFKPSLGYLESMNNKDALLLRIILIDQYRKIILHDPHLPVELLPGPCNREIAHNLVKSIYTQIQERTNREFCEIVNSYGELINDDKPVLTETRFT